ncbi:asparagine synthase-related protein [Nesterenkonia sp. PF2B19]|uniref:asparagine synthase-related protein n=1 Tax=Nesterenkonia sp. PF2B19 TaxID=1881858 RepID=UPI0008730C27|nr:asparagine synthase-related protein [Nesterenkonia sp. PF2B19]
MPTHDAPAQTVHATSSAVEPVFVRTAGAPGESVQALVTSDDLDALITQTSGRLTPDWTAWAEILAFGAPLAGRTPFAGVRRLQPGESATITADGVAVSRDAWSWEDVAPESDLDPRQLTDDVLEALREEIRQAALLGPLNPMLSGGRDSRILASLAAQEAPDGLIAWTTSSDTGTSMEELVAARTASALGLEQRIVPGSVVDFPDDARDYGRIVHHMASFHIWLMPVARVIRGAAEDGPRGAVLDGLGGGVFLGGGFPDDDAPSDVSDTALMDSRFARLGRYLDAAEEILAPGVGAMLEERSRADFEQVARPLLRHPHGATLTAYLTRTLPGISLAPAKVLGWAAPARMPIMAEEVVTRALRVPASRKRDGAWYPHLLERADSRLTGLPTAADLTRRRQHVRRIASVESAEWLRRLIVPSPAGELLSPTLREAPPEEWAAQLSTTKAQHLLRGLAMMALWAEDHADRLTEVQPDLLPTAGARGTIHHG